MARKDNLSANDDIRVEDLMAKKDAEYPEDPARNVCNHAQDPVITVRPESETPGASGFGSFATWWIT